MTVKRFTPRKTPYAEMIALPDGEYVRHEDYAALELHNEYLLARLRKQGEQLEAIGAGGVSARRITSTPSNASAKITERSQAYLDGNLDADEHAAFIKWAREAHDYPDYARLILDSEWCQGAVAGWQGAVESARQRRVEPDFFTYVINGNHRGISETEPPADSYDEGTLRALYAAQHPAEPHAEFDDPRVQQVYEIICGDNHPPAGEHWDGYVSRLIVDALFSGEPVGEIRPDDQPDGEPWAEIWADLPPGTKLYAEPVQKAQKECSKDAERSEPVKVPSDAHRLVLWLNRRREYPMVSMPGRMAGEIADLLAHYSHPVEPEGWQLVPKEPTEEMLEGTDSYLINPDGEPVDIVRVTKSQYWALLEAAPKFGEEE